MIEFWMPVALRLIAFLLVVGITSFGCAKLVVTGVCRKNYNFIYAGHLMIIPGVLLALWCIKDLL